MSRPNSPRSHRPGWMSNAPWLGIPAPSLITVVPIVKDRRECCDAVNTKFAPCLPAWLCPARIFPLPRSLQPELAWSSAPYAPAHGTGRQDSSARRVQQRLIGVPIVGETKRQWHIFGRASGRSRRTDSLWDRLLWQFSIRRASSTPGRSHRGSIRFHVPIDASVDLIDAGCRMACGSAVRGSAFAAGMGRAACQVFRREWAQVASQHVLRRASADRLVHCHRPFLTSAGSRCPSWCATSTIWPR